MSSTATVAIEERFDPYRIVPRPQDVIYPPSGQGITTFFKQMVNVFDDNSIRNDEKKEMLYRRVWFLKNRDGSRFMEQSSEDGKWYEIGDKELFQKFCDCYYNGTFHSQAYCNSISFSGSSTAMPSSIRIASVSSIDMKETFQPHHRKRTKNSYVDDNIMATDSDVTASVNTPTEISESSTSDDYCTHKDMDGESSSATCTASFLDCKFYPIDNFYGMEYLDSDISNNQDRKPPDTNDSRQDYGYHKSSIANVSPTSNSTDYSSSDGTRVHGIKGVVGATTSQNCTSKTQHANPSDIVFGRGRANAGTLDYREVIKKNKPSYVIASSLEKKSIAERVVNKLMVEERRRFLCWIKAEKTFRILGKDDAIKKVTKALGEKKGEENGNGISVDNDDDDVGENDSEHVDRQSGNNGNAGTGNNDSANGDSRHGHENNGNNRHNGSYKGGNHCKHFQGYNNGNVQEDDQNERYENNDNGDGGYESEEDEDQENDDEDESLYNTVPDTTWRNQTAENESDDTNDAANNRGTQDGEGEEDDNDDVDDGDRKPLANKEAFRSQWAQSNTTDQKADTYNDDTCMTPTHGKLPNYETWTNNGHVPKIGNSSSCNLANSTDISVIMENLSISGNGASVTDCTSFHEDNIPTLGTIIDDTPSAIDVLLDRKSENSYDGVNQNGEECNMTPLLSHSINYDSGSNRHRKVLGVERSRMVEPMAAELHYVLNIVIAVAKHCMDACLAAKRYPHAASRIRLRLTFLLSRVPEWWYTIITNDDGPRHVSNLAHSLMDLTFCVEAMGSDNDGSWRKEIRLFLAGKTLLDALHEAEAKYNQALLNLSHDIKNFTDTDECIATIDRSTPSLVSGNVKMELVDNCDFVYRAASLVNDCAERKLDRDKIQFEDFCWEDIQYDNDCTERTLYSKESGPSTATVKKGFRFVVDTSPLNVVRPRTWKFGGFKIKDDLDSLSVDSRVSSSTSPSTIVSTTLPNNATSQSPNRFFRRLLNQKANH